MTRNIIKININNELDVVLAYNRARQLSERLGISMGSRTKFSTAVSEICRNVIEHVGNGQIKFGLAEETGHKYLEAVISDRGRGIGNVESLLKNTETTVAGKGTGLQNSRKLVDYFHIESQFERGTQVTLRQRLPHNTQHVSKATAETWIFELNQEQVSPYAEIKKQNMQLLDVLDNLRERNEVSQHQLKEIRHLNEQLQQYNNDIQELLQERENQNKLLHKINDELDAFAHTVSHDLRAPLQNIKGLASALEDCLHSQKLDDAQEMFKMLHFQTSKMDNFITSILSYSLAGRQNMVKATTDVSELLHDVVNLLGISNSSVVQIPGELPVLVTERIFLHQVFSNLISNALKYHDHLEQPRVLIQYVLKGSLIEFAVEDNGPGIAPESQNKIFEMYETANAHHISTGIGLAIVRKIVKGKGGDVWVESAGRGARFVFTWPANELVRITKAQ
ncbi:histidine kinase [Pontibacter qinzhouensis]|uniref:histidine kinase n=1 Tax=Pontibacter qinzhouensis TaxID=2603253 RepID=A0A5C8K909_9BACT|nr:ATP-binding protein [Pontibacter qinzhouensis]TXK48717.1 histidine kinase [Pontibacter qinzhouensis]